MNKDYPKLVELTLEEQKQQLSEYESVLETETDYNTRLSYERLILQQNQNIRGLEEVLSGQTVPLAGVTPAVAFTKNLIEEQSESADPLTITPSSGLILTDTYRLERVLGRGGMGEVWLATHLLLNEPRAIKLVLSNRSNDPESLERFIQGEARNSLRLIHPNIVRIYDLARHQKTPFIVMEYIGGSESGASDLKAWIKARGRLTLEQIADLLDQIAAGLEVAHRQGLIHCDLKPTNLLMTASGTVKIADFGLVRDLEVKNSGAKGVGTPLYLAPEQAQGNAVTASDIYSLGIILYELLTGYPPFRGNRTSLLVQHASLEPLPPNEFDPQIPASVSEVVLKALAKQPDKRYTTALEFAAAFRQALPKTRLGLSGGAIQTNLPEVNNQLLGREKEVAQVTALFKQPNPRLVSLTGVGGTGKTRLALEIAQALISDFSGGVYFVNLENIRESLGIVSEVAHSLGVRESKGQSLQEAVKLALQGEILLLLDNFEQLISHKELLVEWLDAAPDLKLLVTSRIPLDLPQEQNYPLEPLGLPDPKDSLLNPTSLQKYAAVKLFVERAQEVKKGFGLTEENCADIANICQKLDGLPLALELAAARMKLLTPRQMVERLRDRFKLLTGSSLDLPARQQTLWATIDWSYSLLDESEKRLFGRLAVFAGGCTVEAAEQICNAQNDLGIEVLDGLELLSNKNLLREIHGQDGQARCLMLQTIREYALEKLAQNGENETLSELHANYYLQKVEAAAPKLKGAEQQVALVEMDAEYDNLRQVLEWALQQNKAEVAGRLSANLWRYWYSRSYLSEGRDYLERILKLPVNALPATWAKVMQAIAFIVQSQGDFPLAIYYYNGSLKISQEYDDKPSIASILTNLGRIADHQADYEAADNYFKESLAICREIQDNWGAAANLNNLGNIAANRGEYSQAQVYYEESLELVRVVGDKIYIASGLNNLGNLAAHRGDLNQAHKYFEESLILRREVGDKQGASFALTNLGAVAYVQENYPLALQYYLEGLQTRREIGDKFGIAASLTNLGLLAYKQQKYPEGLGYFRESLVLKKELVDKYGIAVALLGLAAIAAKVGVKESSTLQLQRAARLVGATSAMLSAINGVLQPAEREIYDEVIEATRSHLGEAVLTSIFAEGQALSADEAVNLGLA